MNCIKLHILYSDTISEKKHKETQLTRFGLKGNNDSDNDNDNDNDNNNDNDNDNDNYNDNDNDKELFILTKSNEKHHKDQEY